MGFVEYVLVWLWRRGAVVASSLRLAPSASSRAAPPLVCRSEYVSVEQGSPYGRSSDSSPRSGPSRQRSVEADSGCCSQSPEKRTYRCGISTGLTPVSLFKRPRSVAADIHHRFQGKDSDKKGDRERKKRVCSFLSRPPTVFVSHILQLLREGQASHSSIILYSTLGAF